MTRKSNENVESHSVEPNSSAVEIFSSNKIIASTNLSASELEPIQINNKSQSSVHNSQLERLRRRSSSIHAQQFTDHQDQQDMISPNNSAVTRNTTRREPQTAKTFSSRKRKLEQSMSTLASSSYSQQYKFLKRRLFILKL